MDEFYERRVPEIPRGGRVLDLGGTRIRKRGQFDIERYDLRVVYANLTMAKRPDVQSDAAHVPFLRECFDAVIGAELLEHVRNPEDVVHEAFWLLKVGGQLLAAVPFMYRVQGEPYDFGRYTDHYRRCVLEEIGFRDILIERQGLFFSVLADFFKGYVNAVGVGRPFGRVTRSLVGGGVKAGR